MDGSLDQEEIKVRNPFTWPSKVSPPLKSLYLWVGPEHQILKTP